MELDAPMGHIIRGILMVGATGVVQVIAQLALSHMLEILMGKGEIPKKGGNYYNAASLAESLFESM